MSAVRLVLVGLAASLLGCDGMNTIDRAKLDKFMRDQAVKFGDLRGWDCPEIRLVDGFTSTCTLEFTEGVPRKVLLTVTDARTGAITTKGDDTLIDRTLLLAGITKSSRDKRIALGTVTCPGNQPMTVGHHFVCMATQGAAQVAFTVRVKDGANVTWDVEDRQTLDADLANDGISTWAKHEWGPTATVDCGKGVVFAGLDHVVTCKATMAGQPDRSVRAVLADDGKTTWGWAP